MYVCLITWHVQDIIQEIDSTMKLKKSPKCILCLSLLNSLEHDW